MTRRFELRGNAVFHELGANRVLHFLEKAFVNRRLIRDFLLQGQESFWLQKAERQILELTFDERHSQAMGDGRVNIHGFAGNAVLLGGSKIFQGAHVVEAVSEA